MASPVARVTAKKSELLLDKLSFTERSHPL